MDVASLLKKRPAGVIGILGTAPLEECVEILVENNYGALLVFNEHDKVIGIISERDIMHGLVKWGTLALNHHVSELMTGKLVSCRLHDKLQDLLPIMIDRSFRHLPVIERGEPLGMISMRDLARERISEMELEANVLRDMAATHQPN